MVTVTVLVNGSACSSQTCSSRSSVLRKAGLARRSASRTANSLTDRSSGCPSRVTVRRSGSSSIPSARRSLAPRGRLAPGQGADAQHELGEVERLGEIVVGAQAQAGHAVAGRAGRGEHEHHDPAVVLGDHLAEGVTVDAGQVAVEDDDVVGVEVELGRGLQPVAGGVHRHALVAQALGQDISERPRVLDHQHPHAVTPTLVARAASGSAMLTRRPPSVLARRSSEPPWAATMAATIDRPSPSPLSEPVRSAPSRRNGWPAGHLLLVQDVPAVLHHQAGAVPVGPGGDADPAAGLVVPDRVVDHVVHHPAQQRLAARHPGAVAAAGVVHGEAFGRRCHRPARPSAAETT